MTREEAIENVRSFIDQLTEDCQASIRSLVPELKESEDERIRMALIKLMTVAGEHYVRSATGFEKEQLIAWLEKQKESMEKEYVFRPLAGTDITIAAQQVVRKANEGDRLVLAFNGAYIPVSKGYNCNVNKIVDMYDTFPEKQKEQREATPETYLKGIFDFDDISQLELAVDCYKEKKGRAYPVTVKHQHKVLMKLYDLIGIDREALDQDEEDETD